MRPHAKPENQAEATKIQQRNLGKAWPEGDDYVQKVQGCIIQLPHADGYVQCQDSRR